MSEIDLRNQFEGRLDSWDFSSNFREPLLTSARAAKVRARDDAEFVFTKMKKLNSKIGSNSISYRDHHSFEMSLRK